MAEWLGGLQEKDTGITGVDKKGTYKIIRVFGKDYCNCHPETCSHFDNLMNVDYEKKVYL